MIDGLAADVVTLALAYDIDEIAQRSKSLPADWQKRLPDNSSPYYLDDRLPRPQGQSEADHRLGRSRPPRHQGHHPQPQDQRRRALELSRRLGLCRRANTAPPAAARDYMTRLFRNVPVLDSGARGSTTTFVERAQGDVLLSWENEAFLAVNKLGKGQFEIVIPSLSILAEPPVALVDKVVDQKGTRASGRGLSQISLHARGPGDHRPELLPPARPAVAARHKAQFPDVAC